ncbi:MAG: type II secretion system protein N [Sphingobium sp.]|nr:type II secretion system protein N [Sphingobium sp.]
MTRWWKSGRVRLAAALALLLGLIAAFPLSVAFNMLGLRDMGVTARSLRGPVWWGGAEELTVAGIRLGTVDVFLDPLRLIVGQARVDVVRLTGNLETDLSGGITMGWGSRGVQGVTGQLSLASALAPLPVSRAEFDHFTAHFSGSLCSKAEGRVRVHVPALITGLDLANGLTGDARCEGETLLLPLASQSGQERLEMRFRSNGSYEAVMRIKTSDPVLSSALATSGFRAGAGGEQMLRVTGQL